MDIFFTADTHFGHSNIIRYCNRPFNSVFEMNEKLIDNWNKVIKPGDVVYHLGDFSFKDPRDYLKRLNGLIHLVPGNHDRNLPYFKERNIVLSRLHETKANGQNITMCHYAMKVWNKSHYGAWHLYGHSHGTLPDDKNALSLDVGVDANNFFPLSFNDIKTIMSLKDFKPIDHHKRR